MKRYLLVSIFQIISLVFFAQKVENLRFEQVGKLIIIYYDLTGIQTGQTSDFDVQIFCSADGGRTFGSPLKKVTGDTGTKISGGTGKKVVWDVLAEREKLEGNVLFEIQIKNQSSGTVADSNGNVYNILTIGTQVWMKENLKTTKYNDGTEIQLVKDGKTWAALTTPAYCWYNNDAKTYKAAYGTLYNWYVISTRKLCPQGWHVPSDAEWTTLTTFMGGEDVAGGKLKETGTTHWSAPNERSTNSSGFTALPGGYRYYNGLYGNIGINGNWWSSTEISAASAIGRDMGYNYSRVLRGGNCKEDGFSVRCLKD